MVLVCCLLGLNACASILNPGPPPLRLQLSPPMPGSMMDKPLDRQLVVATPVAGRDVDSDAISLVFSGREVRILAGARWTGTVPHLVQRHLIFALESANALAGVADETAGLAPDARLLSEIRQFSLHYAEEGAIPVAAFAATFRLVGFSTGRVMGVRSVEIRAPAEGRDPSALARAMESALGRGLEQIVPWVVQTMR